MWTAMIKQRIVVTCKSYCYFAMFSWFELKLLRMLGLYFSRQLHLLFIDDDYLGHRLNSPRLEPFLTQKKMYINQRPGLEC
jgi:hypothetical protein